MEYLFAAAGLVLLFLGGEALVRGSVALAQRLGMSSLLIGLTVVGFGTSTPELLVSVQAALDGVPAIALGNVVGSNIANVLLILALGILIAPLVNWQRSASRDALVMVVVSLILFGLVYMPTIGRISGIAMLLTLGVYVYVTYRLEKREGHPTAHESETEEFKDIPLRPALAIVAAVGGIGLLVVGGHLLVDSAVMIARGFGIPEAVIGLTLVAVGTSLPELATSIVAAIRKHPDVVLGNVIGSNIFNILGILGTTVIITELPVDAQFRELDVPVMLAVAIGTLLLLQFTQRIGRPIGLGMLAMYFAYAAYLFFHGASGAGVPA